ncbi:hypothetical protein EYF80_064656 [Liparis tanakae]|uniref:Uncharacterized protein n=1 Tax=Liparis tanakae TaxID=230148 RepID=A0A4Z2E8H2_9TELE|nr:hypothetical protein EYF80_064656 [Liparis tanakae]
MEAVLNRKPLLSAVGQLSIPEQQFTSAPQNSRRSVSRTSPPCTFTHSAWTEERRRGQRRRGERRGQRREGEERGERRGERREERREGEERGERREDVNAEPPSQNQIAAMEIPTMQKKCGGEIKR